MFICNMDFPVNNFPLKNILYVPNNVKALFFSFTSSQNNNQCHSSVQSLNKFHKIYNRLFIERDAYPRPIVYPKK